MPEGDNVWQTARRLAVLSGQELRSTDFRIPSIATVDLSGRRVLETVSRGKHLLTRIEGDATLHSHLKMEGRWDVQPAGSRWRRPAHEARVVLRTHGHEAIGFSVVLDLVPTSAEDRVVGHLGPDLLGPDWDEAEAVRRIEQSPDVPIGMALLDQRNLAGLGNLYRVEVLFLRGITPWTTVGDVPDLPAVIELGRRLMVANKGRVEQITTGSSKRGEQHWVFERGGRPCRRCGTRIRSAEQGDPAYQRLTYWCPHCQLGPAPA